MEKYTYSIPVTPPSHYHYRLPAPTPILAANCLICIACILLDLKYTTTNETAANNTLHPTNSQKSARSCATIRPHDSHAVAVVAP